MKSVFLTDVTNLKTNYANAEFGGEATEIHIDAEGVDYQGYYGVRGESRIVLNRNQTQRLIEELLYKIKLLRIILEHPVYMQRVVIFGRDAENPPVFMYFL